MFQFRRKLNPRRAAAYDGDVDGRIRFAALTAVIDAQTFVQQLFAELVGLRTVFKEKRVFTDAGCAEIVGHAAERQHEVIVVQRLGIQNDLALIIQQGTCCDGLCSAVDPVQLALVKAISPARGVAAVADLFKVRIKRACGDFV